ncbi:uncharacterized protein [Manis javanica]|uniref:uncharacterized protein isoform X5 n=1 Tax=Manis javanica TaxID=9974 RepID=UPI003C6D7123
MGSLTNRSRGPRRRGRGATAALPPPAPSPDEVRGVRGRGAGRGEGGGQRGGRRGAGAAPAGLAPSPAPGQGVTASVGLSAAAAARGSAVQSSARGAAGAAASATDAPGEPDGRAAKRRSWLGCVGGGTTRAHLLAAARARKGDRDLTLTARETQPWGMKRFLRTRKRSKASVGVSADKRPGIDTFGYHWLCML